MILMRIFPLMLVWLLAVGLPFSSTAWAAQSSPPQPFDLELRLDSMSGPLLSSAITDGRVVTAQGWVPLLGGAGKSVLGNLIWQLYEESGKPVPGQTKIRQILEVGGKEFVSFEVNTKTLANGIYYLALTHQKAAKPSHFFQASKAFEVRQPVAITHFLVDESTQGKVHRQVLYEDQAPHIFVYYHLAFDVPSVLIQLDVYDSKGKRIATRSAFKDRDATRRVSRFGIRLNPGLIRAGEKAKVTALLTAPDGSTAQDEVYVQVIAVELQVDMPAVIRSGEVANFQVIVPTTFSPPYTMTFSEKPGLLFNYQQAENRIIDGSIQVDLSVRAGREQIVVHVADQAGRTASTTVNFRIERGRTRSTTMPSAVRQPSLQTGGGGGGIGSSSP